jgi:hypothetical protein
MAERANEPLPRRREPSGSSKLLSADLAAELRPPAERAERAAKAEPARRSVAEAAFSFLGLLDPLPSDYYLG